MDGVRLRWHGTALDSYLLVRVTKDLYLIATLYFTLEDTSEVNFSINSSKLFFNAKEHIL